MDKAELNAKLGYNRELLNQLSNAFDLQEDYNDYGWDKLFEICRYIYNLEQQCKKQKELIEYLKEQINECKLTGNDEDYIKKDVYEEILNKIEKSDK